MSNLQFDSGSSGLLSKNFSAENNLNNGGEFDKQLNTIITKKGKLIKYLSVVYFLGIVICVIYFFFF